MLPNFDHLQNETSETPTTANSGWFLKVIDSAFPQGHRRRLRQFSVLNFLLTLLGLVPTGIGGAVPQIGTASTAVTLNKLRGQITTVALTTVAGFEEEFTLTNSTIAAADIIALSTTYAGAGTPILSVKGVAAGSCKVVVTNVHGSNALNALMVINFAVIKGAAA